MATGSSSFGLSCPFLKLGFSIAVWKADTAKKCSEAATPFDKPSRVATGTGSQGLSAITTNQVITGLRTDREADTTGGTSWHAATAQLHMLAAIPVATILAFHME